MKKVLAVTLLTTFTLGLFVNPSYAILDKSAKQAKKQIEQTNSVLETINYDWWKKTNDSYLEDYILRAVQNNHDIKTAQLAVEPWV